MIFQVKNRMEAKVSEYSESVPTSCPTFLFWGETRRRFLSLTAGGNTKPCQARHASKYDFSQLQKDRKQEQHLPVCLSVCLSVCLTYIEPRKSQQLFKFQASHLPAGDAPIPVSVAGRRLSNTGAQFLRRRIPEP